MNMVARTPLSPPCLTYIASLLSPLKLGGRGWEPGTFAFSLPWREEGGLKGRAVQHLTVVRLRDQP